MANTDYASQARRLYMESFPPEERRPWEGIVNPESEYGPDLCHLTDGESYAGFMTLWDFGTFRYLEHFATMPELRGRGIGCMWMKKLIESSSSPVVLEVERPGDNDMAERRIGFYRRCGMYLLDYDYIQPPYAPGLPEVPLLLMSSDPALDPAAVAATLHREVYGRR
ncbi:MAG: GNAT family N-acetyltransferase [Muribaculaceae bacterium]|nr:GNAT family N-acetyltransferase [Muribaculaceae bacterium]